MTSTSVSTQIFNNSIVRLVLVVGVLLMIPLIGMQLSQSINWTLSDFIVAGVMLFGTGLFYQLIVKRVHNKKYRLYGIFALILGLAWLWIELSVGLVTNWGS